MVSMHGLGWRSPLGLSARILTVRLGPAALDYGALLTSRSIKLRTVPTGSARCVFSERDFANFLAHPFVATAASGAARRVRGGPCSP